MMPSPPPASPEPEDEYARLEYRRDGFAEDPDAPPRSAGGEPPVGAAVGSAIDRPIAPDHTPDRPYDADPGMPDSAYGFDAPDGGRRGPAGSDLDMSQHTDYTGADAVRDQAAVAGDTVGADDLRTSADESPRDTAAAAGAAGPGVVNGAAGAGTVYASSAAGPVATSPARGSGAAGAGAAGPGWAAGDPDDMISILVADHRAVEHLFTQLDSMPADPERRRDLVDVAIAELMRHAAAEEQHLYPAVRRHVPDGDQLADRELAGHGTAEELMNDLMHTEADDPRFVSLTRRLIETVRSHVREEEAELFPLLRRAVDAQTLIRLGTEVLSAKRLAPTRPHPSAPDHPPLNKVTGPLAGLIDQAVDSLTDRPTSVDDLAEGGRR